MLLTYAINPIIYNNVIEPKKPLGFIFKRSIFSAQTVRTISKPLSPLFNKYIIVCMLILAVILNTVYLLQPNILHYNGHIGLEGILVIFSITILSSLFHEFGHASACIRYGVLETFFLKFVEYGKSSSIVLVIENMEESITLDLDATVSCLVIE